MYENARIQTVAKHFSRSREREPYISRTFVTLNVLYYKRAVRSYKLCVNKTVAVAYSSVGQAVIVVIIVVSVKFEQWHINSANNEDNLIKTKTHICFYLVCN